MFKLLANDGIDPIGKEILEKAGFTVDTQTVPQEQLAEALQNYDALTVRSATKVRKELINSCPNLKLIGRGGVGMDNIDVDYARNKGIAVVNTPAASSLSVAELVFAHLFTGVRFLQDANRAMPSKGATAFNDLKKAYAKGIELRGKTIGIIGFGRIGREVAKRAHFGFGMKIVVQNRSKIGNDILIRTNAHQVDNLDELLETSDFISLHCPGGDDNHHLISTKQFKKMKNSAILINTARGEVVDDNALILALKSKEISAVGLDVFNNEPNINPELIKFENAILLPHLGSATQETREAMGFRVLDNIADFFEGKVPRDKVA